MSILIEGQGSWGRGACGEKGHGTDPGFRKGGGGSSIYRKGIAVIDWLIDYLKGTNNKGGPSVKKNLKLLK